MRTGQLIREGRGFLGIQRSELAFRVTIVTTAVIARAEAVDDEPPITIAQGAAIERAMDRAGNEFTLTGPRLRKKEA